MEHPPPTTDEEPMSARKEDEDTASMLSAVPEPLESFSESAVDDGVIENREASKNG